MNLAAGPGSAFPVAAYDGTNYWVAFSPYSSGTSGSVTTCYAQRVTPAGALLDTTAITLVTLGASFSTISSTALAFGSSNGLLVYFAYNVGTNQYELHGVLVNPNESVSAGPFAVATDNSTHINPAVAFDGTHYLVVWKQSPTNGSIPGNIYGVKWWDPGSRSDPGRQWTLRARGYHLGSTRPPGPLCWRPMRVIAEASAEPVELR